MSVTVKVFKKEVAAAMKKAEDKALIAIGEHMQDALAGNTHRVTGLLANSYNYRTPEKQGPFGDGPLTNTKQGLGSEEQASQPPEKTVRIASALQYTDPYNRRFKVFEQTVDQNQKNFGGLVAAAFKGVS